MGMVKSERVHHKMWQTRDRVNRDLFTQTENPFKRGRKETRDQRA